jgi:hypothetical protein
MRPTPPTIIRMMPTMSRSIPLASFVTAKARIAPTAIRIRLTTAPMQISSSEGLLSEKEVPGRAERESCRNPRVAQSDELD